MRNVSLLHQSEAFKRRSGVPDSMCVNKSREYIRAFCHRSITVVFLTPCPVNVSWRQAATSTWTPLTPAFSMQHEHFFPRHVSSGGPNK